VNSACVGLYNKCGNMHGATLKIYIYIYVCIFRETEGVSKMLGHTLRMYVYTHLHTHTHTHVHTYIHTYIHMYTCNILLRHSFQSKKDVMYFRVSIPLFMFLNWY
jgi:hypothetical protein